MMMMMMIQIQTNGTPEVTLITKQTQSKNLCKKRGQTQPGLVAFYVQKFTVTDSISPTMIM